MASNGPSVPLDLSKLTVPQLKALCKERRITGYSKLTKAALLQRLAEVAAPPKTTSVVPSVTAADVATPPAYIESSTVRREGNITKVVHQPVQPSTGGNTESTETSTAKAPLHTEVPKGPSQNRTVISTTSTQKTSGTKRPAHIDIPASLKRIRTSLRTATDVGHEPPVPKTSTLHTEVPKPSQNSAVISTTSTQKTSGKRPAHIDIPAPLKRIRTSLKTATDVGHEPPVPKASTLHAEVAKPSQNPTVISTTSTQKPSGTKSPAHIDIPAPQKRIRTSLKPATNVGHEPPVLKTSTFQQKLPVDSSAFKVPELPAQPKSSFHGSALTLAKQPSGTLKRSAVPCQTTGGPGRFKALVVSGPKSVELDQANREPSRAPAVPVIPRAVDSALVSNFHPRPLPVLCHISFPPKASERKWVYRWAVVLSSLSPADRQTCTLVSRTFRYAGRIVLLS